jgi:hypothetical protein
MYASTDSCYYQIRMSNLTTVNLSHNLNKCYALLLAILVSVLSISTTGCSSIIKENISPSSLTIAKQDAMNIVFRKSQSLVVMRSDAPQLYRELIRGAGQLSVQGDKLLAEGRRTSDTLYIPLRDVSHVQCTPDNTVAKVMIGLAGGALLGGVLGTATASDNRSSQAVAFAAGGAVVGGVLAGLLQKEIHYIIVPDSTAPVINGSRIR